jgi:hypothetical protein
LYPHKPAQVVSLVAKRSGKRFTSHNHTQAWHKFKVRPRSHAKQPDVTIKDYCIYHPAHGDYTYSEKWIEFLAEKISTEEGFREITDQKI